MFPIRAPIFDPIGRIRIFAQMRFCRAVQIHSSPVNRLPGRENPLQPGKFSDPKLRIRFFAQNETKCPK